MAITERKIGEEFLLGNVKLRVEKNAMNGIHA